MSLVFEENILKDTSFAKRLDELSEGVQVLREYIFFNRFNFLKQCQIYDKLDTGKLSVEKFEVALKRSPYIFTSKHIHEIINDAPKNRKNEIMYRHMYFLISKGEKPKTKLSAKLMAQGHSSSSILLAAESPKHEENSRGDDYETFLSNFFKTKTLYDFESFDLNLLDTQLLQEKNKPKGTQEELSIKNLYAANNISIIENFKITIAKTIYQVLDEADKQQPIPSDDQIFARLQKFLRKTEDDMYRSLNELELGKILQKFNLKLTIDETNLFYFLIYGEFSENTVNLNCLANWVKAYYHKRLKHIIRISELIKDLPTGLTRKIEIPPLYQDIIKVIQELGFEPIETSLGFLNFKNAISFDNLKKFLREYSINYNNESFNEFKLWLAQEGVLDLTNKENISQGTTYIVADRLLRVLRKTCQELYIPITLPKKEHITLQEAILNFNKKVWQAQWKNIEDHVLVLCDSFRMIDEIRIRDLLKNMVYGLDSLTINTIFDSFKYNQNISKGSLQRKIFVDELFAKVRDINFNPLEVLRKPEIVEAAAEIEDLQNFIKNTDLINQQPSDYILKQAIDPADADPKRVLEKLEKILSDLMAAPAFKNISVEEKKIPTLPLLKIFESVDRNKQGYLEKGEFRRVLVESFPIFNSLQIDTLVKMADGVASTQQSNSGLDPSVAGQYIPYYFFLLQIEKYFELNKLCRQYQ